MSDQRCPSCCEEHQLICAEHEVALENATLRAERDTLQAFIEQRGYRRCDIPACNCGSFHEGHAETRLREISDSLQEAGLNGGTVHGGVLEFIRRAEQAEARLTEARDRIGVWREAAQGRQAMSDWVTLVMPILERYALLCPSDEPETR